MYKVLSRQASVCTSLAPTQQVKAGDDVCLVLAPGFFFANIRQCQGFMFYKSIQKQFAVKC